VVTFARGWNTLLSVHSRSRITESLRATPTRALAAEARLASLRPQSFRSEVAFDREGVRPDGANYFPVFPYPSFTGITDGDALAIKAYLFSLPPVHRENRPHDVAFPFSWRFLQTGWKLLFFTPGPFQPAPDRSVTYNRGAYLVTALAHCGECHTPRNFLGATRSGQRLAGTPDGPDGQLVPNITPDPDTGIGKWEKDDVVELLRTGTTPEQSKVKGAMRETVDDGLKYLSDSDLEAIADYLFAQPPIVHNVTRKR
jgi:mono/diheme cytochrome c family protein